MLFSSTIQQIDYKPTTPEKTSTYRILYLSAKKRISKKKYNNEQSCMHQHGAVDLAQNDVQESGNENQEKSQGEKVSSAAR